MRLLIKKLLLLLMLVYPLTGVAQTEVISEKYKLEKKCLNKEIHPGTKPNVDFIFKILEDAYKSGLHYDVTDMRNVVFAFAANSTNQAETCIKLVNKMHFKSEDISIGDTTLPINPFPNPIPSTTVFQSFFLQIIFSKYCGKSLL